MFDESTQPEPIGVSNNEYFELIEHSLVDPHMQRIIDKAKGVNEMLQIFPLDEEGRKKLTNDLDSDWKFYNHSHMIISGNGIYQSPEGPIEIVFDDLPSRSNGFFVRELKNTLDPSLSNAEVIFDFLVNPQNVADQKPDEHLRELFVGLDDVHIETPVASTERAIAWLELAYPDFVDEVDRRIVNTASESEALLSLRSLDVDAFVDAKDPFARNCVNRYVSSLVQLDYTAPYGTYVSGKVAVETDPGVEKLVRKEPQKVLTYLAQLGLKNFASSSSNTNRWGLAVYATVLPMDRRGSTEVWGIPLATIRGLWSVRSSFYNDTRPSSLKG